MLFTFKGNMDTKGIRKRSYSYDSIQFPLWAAGLEWSQFAVKHCFSADTSSTPFLCKYGSKADFSWDVTASTTAWQCYLWPILSSHNQLTRLNAVSTMSRLETSPTSTRPVSTANFILIPLIGTPGLSPTAPGRPSFPSSGCAAPAVSSLAIAKEEDGTGGVHR